MTYMEIIDEFWKQDKIDPMPPLDMKFYFYLLNECKLRNWINPFELQPRIIELSLMITRKTIGEVRNRLKQKGLIDFTAGNNRPTVYNLLNLTPDDGNCYPQVTLSKQLGLHLVNNSGYNSETIEETPSKERSPIPPKEYTPKETDINNNISPSRARTREEIELERFDGLLQEVVDGKHQQWEDQMRKKHRIDSVLDYLPSFRDHVIANSKMASVADVNGFKQYFNVAFRFFSRISPIELLGKYENSAKSEKFRQYCNWLSSACPNVARGLVPLSEEEFQNLFESFDKEVIFCTLRDLNEREDLIAKYFSTYRTLLKWLTYDKTN